MMNTGDNSEYVSASKRKKEAADKFNAEYLESKKPKVRTPRRKRTKATSGFIIAAASLHQQQI